MGFRTKLKGRVKAALGMEGKSPGTVARSPAPSKHHTSISEDTGKGNLRGDEDVAWYLKYEDNDGWESTDVTADVDED